METGTCGGGGGGGDAQAVPAALLIGPYRLL